MSDARLSQATHGSRRPRGPRYKISDGRRRVSKTPLTLIVDALREFVEQHGIDAPGPLDGDTRLFGREGLLDSMGLVTLVVAVEQANEDEYGVGVSLSDDPARPQRTSPYPTVGPLPAYAPRLLHRAVARG